MNIHEYQGQAILSSYGVSVAEGFVAENADQAMTVAAELRNKFNTDLFVIKAQIHAGGRGKAGGVRIATTVEEVGEITKQMIGMKLVTHQTGPEGKRVNKVLVARNVFYKGESVPREFYLSILLNRSTGRYMVVYSPEGGMSIEEVAEKSPELIYHEDINPVTGLLHYQARRIAFNLKLEGKAFKEMENFLEGLYEAFTGTDAQLFEINPLLKTSDNRIMALDCKVVLDDSALYRHPELALMRDIREEDPIETEAVANHLNFVKLNGNVGCMVNGAGLAMATMDIIKLSGGEPANFLDVGGGANAETVKAGFRIILKDPAVKAILINIFGGIVRGERIANGVVEAYKAIGQINIPVIVRLEGTNAREAMEIINNSGLRVRTASSFTDAAVKVREALDAVGEVS